MGERKTNFLESLWDGMKKKIEEKKAKEQGVQGKEQAKDEAIDLDQVEKIVTKMKKKYSKLWKSFLSQVIHMCG